MAVQVYRAGTTHNIRGIECEIGNFSITSYMSMLNDGWYASPDEIGNDAQDEDEDEEKINPVRILAKEKGIEGWDIKRIKTLEALLDEQEN